MTKVISIINLKGGVGKTTLTLGLAEILSEVKNKKVLVLDLDPQTNITVSLIGSKKWEEKQKQKRTIYHLFKEYLDNDSPNPDIGEYITREVSNLNSGNGIKNLDLIPSSISLLDIQENLYQINNREHGTKAHQVLKDALSSIIDQYDYVIIDCPPNVGLITKSGLLISHYYLIPVIADYLSTWGLPMIYGRVDEFSKKQHINLKPLGIVITKFRIQSAVHKQHVEILKANQWGGGIPVLLPPVPETNDLASAAAWEDDFGEPIKYSAIAHKYGNGDGWKAIKQIASEVISRA